MKNEQKGFGLIGILVVVAIIAVVGGGFYYSQNTETEDGEIIIEKSLDVIDATEEVKKLVGENDSNLTNILDNNTLETTNVPNSIPEEGVTSEVTDVQIGTSLWKTYRNNKHGFEFLYNPNWVVAKEIGDDTHPYMPGILFDTFIQTGNSPLENSYTITLYSMPLDSFLNDLKSSPQGFSLNNIVDFESKNLSGKRFTIGKDIGYHYLLSVSQDTTLALNPRGLSSTAPSSLLDELAVFAKSFVAF